MPKEIRLIPECRGSWKEDVKQSPNGFQGFEEQLSVSYAGLGMKYASDYNRNIYLDILNLYTSG